MASCPWAGGGRGAAETCLTGAWPEVGPFSPPHGRGPNRARLRVPRLAPIPRSDRRLDDTGPVSPHPGGRSLPNHQILSEPGWVLLPGIPLQRGELPIQHVPGRAGFITTPQLAHGPKFGDHLPDRFQAVWNGS